MKLFTVEEANRLLPKVRAIVEEIQRAHRQLRAFREEARRAAQKSEANGGIDGGALFAAAFVGMSERILELETLGVQLKDCERGLVDFPHLRDGRVVLLCWHVGEGNQIEWWHEWDAGFAGRQRL